MATANFHVLAKPLQPDQGLKEQQFVSLHAGILRLSGV